MSKSSQKLAALASDGSSLAYENLEHAFPGVDPGLVPFGDKVIVQIRTPMKKTKSGIFLPEDTRDTEKWNTQVARVVAYGPLAFHSRDTQQPWPEGNWVEVGDFVRVPKYGGDRWEVPVAGSPDPALFAIFTDLDLIGKITGDPLQMVAYIP